MCSVVGATTRKCFECSDPLFGKDALALFGEEGKVNFVGHAAMMAFRVSWRKLWRNNSTVIGEPHAGRLESLPDQEQRRRIRRLTGLETGNRVHADVSMFRQIAHAPAKRRSRHPALCDGCHVGAILSFRP